MIGEDMSKSARNSAMGTDAIGNFYYEIYLIRCIPLYCVAQKHGWTWQYHLNGIIFAVHRYAVEIIIPTLDWGQCQGDFEKFDLISDFQTIRLYANVIAFFYPIKTSLICFKSKTAWNLTAVKHALFFSCEFQYKRNVQSTRA